MVPNRVRRSLRRDAGAQLEGPGLRELLDLPGPVEAEPVLDAIEYNGAHLGEGWLRGIVEMVFKQDLELLGCRLLGKCPCGLLFALFVVISNAVRLAVDGLVRVDPGASATVVLNELTLRFPFGRSKRVRTLSPIYHPSKESLRCDVRRGKRKRPFLLGFLTCSACSWKAAESAFLNRGSQVRILPGAFTLTWGFRKTSHP